MFDRENKVYDQNNILRSEIEELKVKNDNLLKIIEKDKNNIAILRKELKEKAEEDQKKKMEKFYQNLNVSIDNYVDEMLQDEEINSMIPDYIEKKIYKNVFSLVLKLMKNFTESASISFLDQEITFNLKSKNDSLE